eukprot:NODE_4749_length_1023_cov_19.632222_g4544_i0.p1 GENE.NODE_4749_length_1023_cov_19.632222_g4544_i0~~NODE_4749_length_1023_cov_19.632222_g4544_i0.p1  ORF type:complete len:211 (-),score=13.67 NODE_4749_length_1023_cov_19.632222_g4544_i0:52-684(-)
MVDVGFSLVTSSALYGDPHFKAQSGGIYTITGRVGAIYKIIQHSEIHWNMQFVGRRSNPEKGTYGGPCGFVVDGHKLMVDPRNSSFILDGVSHRNTYIRAHHTIPLGRSAFMRPMHRSVLIQVPCFKIVLQRVVKRITATSGHRVLYYHYDFNVVHGVNATCRQAHGLLGQTFKLTRPVHPLGNNGENVIEGTVAQYEVDSLISAADLMV